jgi:cellulose biosynthesis protein BcsQ
LTDFFGAGKVMDAIPDRVAIERAHTNHTDVYAYDPTSDGAQLYLQATRQHLPRIGLLEAMNG